MKQSICLLIRVTLVHANGATLYLSRNYKRMCAQSCAMISRDYLVYTDKLAIVATSSLS